MSHIAVRMVADFLKDATYGVNAIAAVVPRDGADPAPPTANVYDETRHGWVARQNVPKPQTSIQFPAVVVFLQSVKYDSGIPDSQSTGARTINSTVQLAIQLLMVDSATEEAVTSGIYLLRAIRNSLLQFDDPPQQTARTRVGVELQPSTDVMQGQLDAPVGDNVVSIGALVVVYPTIETTALT